MNEKSKSNLRSEARERRKALAAACPDFVARLAVHADALGLGAETVLGAYAALPGEADPSLLVARLEALGCIVAFPRVAAKDRPLSFHHVPAGQAMSKGAFGVPEPSPDWPAADPKILLVPLLAFDAGGYRLGYGGGYYDRTLAVLQGARAIGIAYAGQEVPSLPRTAYDRPLDEIVTEAGLRRFHHT